MKLYAPEYYRQFACIADKCTHNCCIGWEIDIDPDTMRKYRSLTDGYGGRIIKTIDETDTPHFRLAAGERCPHLDERGLCRIISSLGDGYLCDICREHPRFYNDTCRGKEVGLGMACEEACRLILSSDSYASMVEIGEIADDIPPIYFDAPTHRARIYSILADGSVPYPERLARISSEYRVSPVVLSDDEWRGILSSLEYLDESHRQCFSCYSSDVSTPIEWEKTLERALAYFLYRHGSGVRDEQEFRGALGLSLFCERLLASMARTESVQNVTDFVRLARILSEEIEYSEENTDAILFEFSFEMEE